jgi:hypothetical protein
VRWAGLTAPGCALCGRKSPPRRTLGWHRRAPKARLELRWVRPGISQAPHPGKYKGAPWLGRGPHQQGKGAPPRRTWSSAGCALGAPLDSAGAGAPERRDLSAKVSLGWARAHTASPRPRVRWRMVAGGGEGGRGGGEMWSSPVFRRCPTKMLLTLERAWVGPRHKIPLTCTGPRTYMSHV